MNKKLASGLAVLALSTMVARADIPSDSHVQSDRLYSLDLDSANSFAVGNVVSEAFLTYVKSMLERDYPVRSILLHLTTQGVSISDAAYLLALVDKQRAGEFYSAAVEMLPTMPGWVCGTHADLDIRYPIYYTGASLGAKPSVAEVAKRFFEHGEEVGFKGSDGRWGYPDPWKKQYHFIADVNELLQIAKDSVDRAGIQSWWYQPGPGTDAPGQNGMPVFLSLYKYDKSISVDATVQQLEALKASGKTRVPVIVFNNESGALPTSRECKVTDAEDPTRPVNADVSQMTIRHVAESYFDCHRRLTPPRERMRGDYHVLADIKEVKELFGLPSAGGVAPERWAQIEEELKTKGFVVPLMVTMSLDARLLWSGERDRLAVAETLGIDKIPVVFMTHELSREDCAAIPNCEAAICRAVVSAGADFGTEACPAMSNAMWAKSGAQEGGTSSARGETAELLNKAAGEVR